MYSVLYFLTGFLTWACTKTKTKTKLFLYITLRLHFCISLEYTVSLAQIKLNDKRKRKSSFPRSWLCEHAEDVTFYVMSENYGGTDSW